MFATIQHTSALIAAKVCRWLLVHVAHRSASQLPGRVALALDSYFISRQAAHLKHGSVVVCGTNGKTTTNNILADSFEAQGYAVVCNRAGANMAPGIATALLDACGKDWALIECDELSTPRIVKELQPQFFVLLNLFRDQLDRSGEIDHVQATIARALNTSSHTVYCECADDPLCEGIQRMRTGEKERITFGIAQALTAPQDRVAEARFCQICGHELAYDYRIYAQLGAYSCPRKDFCRPALDVAASSIELKDLGISFVATKKNAASTSTTTTTFTTSFGGLYMVYNVLAAWTVASLCGVSATSFERALQNYHPQNGRLQQFDIGGRPVILNLAKNPTGFNQNISLMQNDKRTKVAYFVINDNYNDGRDISWIYDVDFERLALPNILEIKAGGTRAYDVAVRLKYAGITAEVYATVDEMLAALDEYDISVPLYILCNYSALWPLKARLEELEKAKGTSHHE